MLEVAMGFRFRKRVKLFPGVRLNLSLGGPSLSVGGRGATVNFSSRGARSTFGIPGTGLSYSSSLGGSGGRRPSRRQIEASIRRSQTEARRAAALAEAEAEEAELDDLVNTWRDVPSLPTDAEYRLALEARPFKFGEALPELPDATRTRQALRAAIDGAVRSETPRPFVKAGTAMVAAALITLSGMALSVGIAAAADSRALGVVLTFGSVLMGAAFALVRAAQERGRWRVAIEGEVSRRMDDAWDPHWRSVQAHHLELVHAWEERREVAQDEFDREEADRTTWARRLVRGDVLALDEAVSASLGDLDFPFETECRVEVPDPANAYVLLDLPEIEDVIPETRMKVLKDGTKKEAKRSKQDRVAAYAQLACGLGLLVARAAHAAAPTLEAVHVAAYTQRRQKRSGAIDDDFVYEVIVSRSVSAGLNHETLDPVEQITRLPGRVKLAASGDFAKIPAPKWADLTEG